MHKRYVIRYHTLRKTCDSTEREWGRSNNLNAAKSKAKRILKEDSSAYLVEVFDVDLRPDYAVCVYSLGRKEVENSPNNKKDI